MAEYELTERQYVIWRGETADILIEDPFVSKMHAMLQVYHNAIMLVDLNSTNGTTVNSRIVLKSVLHSDDVIMLGKHRLKIENAPAISAEMDDAIKATDTVTMQSLDDLRRARAKRTVKMLKHKSSTVAVRAAEAARVRAARDARRSDCEQPSSLASRHPR